MGSQHCQPDHGCTGPKSGNVTEKTELRRIIADGTMCFGAYGDMQVYIPVAMATGRSSWPLAGRSQIWLHKGMKGAISPMLLKGHFPGVQVRAHQFSGCVHPDPRCEFAMATDGAYYFRRIGAPQGCAWGCKPTSEVAAQFPSKVSCSTSS